MQASFGTATLILCAGIAVIAIHAVIHQAVAVAISPVAYLQGWGRRITIGQPGLDANTPADASPPVIRDLANRLQGLDNRVSCTTATRSFRNALVDGQALERNHGFALVAIGAGPIVKAASTAKGPSIPSVWETAGPRPFALVT